MREIKMILKWKYNLIINNKLKISLKYAIMSRKLQHFWQQKWCNVIVVNFVTPIYGESNILIFFFLQPCDNYQLNHNNYYQEELKVDDDF